MKKITFSLLLALAFVLPTLSSVFAQTETLKLSLSRDWGYGGFNNDIQGTFSMHVKGPDTLVKVEFYIDDTKIGEDIQSPFALQFITDSYALGWHTMSAVGYTSDGQQLKSNSITANFVEPQSVGKFIYPVLAIVVVAILASTLGPLLMNRGKLVNLPLGEERHYSMGGGGICSKCHRPFALPLFSMNLGLSKFARCPYCGKWSAVRLLPIDRLREAERAELEQAKTAQPVIGETEEDRLKKELDNSKYQ
jgi:Bacterial Ig domain